MLFEEYVATRGAELVRFAYVLCGDAHHAQDLVQAALIKAHGRWGRVIRADHPDAYVRKIVANSYVDHRRRRSSGETATADADAAWQSLQTSDSAELQADQDVMWTALSLLPPKQRAVLVLRFYDGYDDAGIADLLDCSPGTVRSNASRGLATLRKHWTTTEPLEAAPRNGRGVP